MNVVRLAERDRGLLSTRYAEHDNSHRRMRGALLEAGATAVVERLDALRKMERAVGIDLGSVCHRFDRRSRPDTHPIERLVIDFVTETRHGAGGEELWVIIDRVAQVRELMEGRLVGEPES